jgi:RNA polymerase sigma-70 factor (ECF subfamily)
LQKVTVANNNDDIILLRKISNGDKNAFGQFFNTFYNDLVFFATRFTYDIDASEEIVQTFFVKFWEERNCIIISTSLKSYLLKSVQNSCLDWIRHRDVRNRYATAATINPILNTNDTENYIFFHELETAIEQHLNAVPTNDAEIFRMNRFEGLTYAQIAKKRQISVRVVELRISKVLKLLRTNLKDFKIFSYFL